MTVPVRIAELGIVSEPGATQEFPRLADLTGTEKETDENEARPDQGFHHLVSERNTGFCFDNSPLKPYIYRMESLLTSKNLFILIVLIVLGGATTFGVQRYLETKEMDSKSALYRIQKSFLDENAAVPEKDRTPGVTLDVDASFPKTVAELNAISAASGTPKRVGFEAALKLGNLYFEHNQFKKAEPAFQKAVSLAGSSFQKATALYFLGLSQEKNGDAKAAITQFQSGLGENVEGLKADLLLGLVRLNLQAGDASKAKVFSERLNKEMEGSKQAEMAQSWVKENS